MAAELYFYERALEVMKQASLQLTDIQNKKQMTVYNPTAAEIEQFRTVMQPPASEYIKGQLDDVKWLDLLYAEIARVEKEF